MKIQLIAPAQFVWRRTLALAHALLAMVCSCFGQEGEPQENAPAAAASDPFAKEEKARPENTSGSGEKEQFQQIASVVEHIEVSKDDFDNWLVDNSGAPDGNALRTDAQKWIDAGSAEVLASQMLIARSGQRAKVESTRELIHPRQFQAVQWRPASPFPSDFEYRHIGPSQEFDPVLDQGGNVVHTAISSYWAEFLSDGRQRAEPNGSVQEGDVRQPLFHTIRPTAQIISQPGQWLLLQTDSARSKHEDLDAAPLDPDRTVLIFLRASVHHSEVQHPGKEVNVDASATQGYLKFEWIDVDQASVTKWLLKDDFGRWIGGKDGARSSVAELIQNGEADLVYTRLVPFRSGNRSKIEGIREVAYAAEYEQTEQHALSLPQKLETRSTGVTVEVDPVLSDSGLVVNLNSAPEIVSRVGQSVSQRYFDLDSQEWKPDVVMPIFYSERATTQTTLIVDEPLLMAITMPHDDQGYPDRGTRRLWFVTALVAQGK